MNAGVNDNAGNQKIALTVNEFCELFGVSRSLTYREMNIGRLTARKVGRRTFILRADADSWLASLPTTGAAV